MKDPVWTLSAWIIHSDKLDAERERAVTLLAAKDSEALILARENQRLRDEAHNGILNQLRDERASFATKLQLDSAFDRLEATIQPVQDFMVSQQGRSGGSLDARSILFSVSLVFVGIAGVVVAIIYHGH